MTKFLKKIKAFTLSEILIVFTIIGVIAVALVKPMRNVSNSHINKFMYYSAFSNLQNAIARMSDDGCTATDISNSYCDTGALPKVKTVAGGRGFCDRLSELFNIVGTANCSLTSTDAGPFTAATANFIVTNGMRFFISNLSGSTYTVYVDIDGSRRNGTLNSDVFPLSVYLDWTVIPRAASIADLDTQYLSATVNYLDSTSNRGIASSDSGTIYYSGVSYRQAICASAKLSSTIQTAYCSTTYPVVTKCQNGTYTCGVKINKPGFMFFSR